jgi:hypothetical protein
MYWKRRRQFKGLNLCGHAPGLAAGKKKKYEISTDLRLQSLKMNADATAGQIRDNLKQEYRDKQ